MPKFRYDLAAQVLIEALFTTDDEACEKYGITDRTLRRFRQRLAEDPQLNALFEAKKRKLDEQWADVLPAAMREAVQSINEISKAIRFDRAARLNPFSLEKLAGALKLLADVHYTGKVIDARIADRNRSEKRLPGESTAAAVSDYAN